MYQHTLRRAAGHTLGIDMEGRPHETDTQQCGHCDMHFNFVQGQTYGFCGLCMKATCGNPMCMEHFPFEERMDLYESGRLPEITSSRDEILPEYRKIIV